MRRVNPQIYTQKYYLSECNGYEDFISTRGKHLSERFTLLPDNINILPHYQVLDLGCGRGEAVIWAALTGAREIWGVDYSPSAIKIAKHLKSTYSAKIRNKCHFQVMDAKKLLFPDQSFDLIICLEVIEHLYPEEQQQVLNEMSRVLKPTGKLFIHTAPSRWFLDFTYRYYSYPFGKALITLWNLLFHRQYPLPLAWKDLRNPYHQQMHVGEPDYFSLTRMLVSSGFFGSIRSSNLTVLKPVISWKDRLYNLFIYLDPLSNYFPVNILFGNDFYALLGKRL